MIAALVQTDAEVVHQLQRLVTTQTVIAIFFGLVALAALGVAIGALIALRKAVRSTGRILNSGHHLANEAESVLILLKGRVSDVLESVEDIGNRLKAGADSVEDRVKRFGTVVDVVQTEAEELLLDAASTARGVHTAAAMLRTGRRPVEAPSEYEEDEEEEVYEDEEEYDSPEIEDEDAR